MFLLLVVGRIVEVNVKKNKKQCDKKNNVLYIVYRISIADTKYELLHL